MTSPAFQKYMPPARRSAWVALAATVAALTWQAAAVHFNYRGNWTALFCIGEKSSMPPDLQSGAWIFPDSKGYDGQYYRVVAHDPWMREGLSRFVDSTSRYRRILLPAAAWLLAFGQPLWVDRAYILLVLVSLFAGTWFTAMWVAVQNRSEWWGLGFLLLPGVVITLNRMTVDITEYACLAAALYFWRRKSWIGCWIAGAAAFLTRDLGLIVIASLVGMCLLQRFWTRAAVFAASALPALLWNFHVAQTIVGDDAAISRSVHLIPSWAFQTRIIGIGPFLAILRPPAYPLPPWIAIATQWLDRISIAAVIMGVCMAAALAASAAIKRHPFTLELLLCALYATLFLMVTSRGFWIDPYSYPRAFSPLVGLIAWRGVLNRRAWFALPWLGLLLRAGWQLGPQAIGILQGIAGKAA